MSIPASSAVSSINFPALNAAALRTASPGSTAQFKEATATNAAATAQPSFALGADNSLVTSAVLDSLGILQNASPSAVANALASVFAANLGVTATSLEGTATSVNDLALTALFQGSSTIGGTDATAQTFSDLLIAAANLAATSADVNSTLSGSIAPSDLQTALLNSTTLAVSSLAQADVTLVAAAGGSSKPASAAAALITSAVASVQNLTLDNISAISSSAAPLGLALANQASETALLALPIPAAAVAPQVATTTVTAPPAATNLPTAAIAAAASATTTNISGDQFASSMTLQSQFPDAVAQAVSTVATDPSYAAAAAELYASAAIFHFMQAEAQQGLLNVTGSIPPVHPIRRSNSLSENRYATPKLR